MSIASNSNVDIDRFLLNLCMVEIVTGSGMKDHAAQPSMQKKKYINQLYMKKVRDRRLTYECARGQMMGCKQEIMKVLSILEKS